MSGVAKRAGALGAEAAVLAPPYRARWNALLFAMSAGMLLGAAIALEETALCAPYDRYPRPWRLEAARDERIGGLVVWIPGSIPMVPVFLRLVRLWDAREGRLEERRRGGLDTGAPAGPRRNFGLAIAVLATSFGAAGERPPARSEPASARRDARALA